MTFVDKSYTSRTRFNLAKKDERKTNKAKSRITKGDKKSKSVSASAEASQSSQMSSECLLYGKETDSNLESGTVTAIGGKDTALFLFRALGKILYCKSEFLLLYPKSLYIILFWLVIHYFTCRQVLHAAHYSSLETDYSYTYFA